MWFSIDTTCIGVMRLHMEVNVTTSEKRIETQSNTWIKQQISQEINHHFHANCFLPRRYPLDLNHCESYLRLSVVSFDTTWKLKKLCVIIHCEKVEYLVSVYSFHNSSVLFISSSNFFMLSSNFLDLCCSWSKASFNSTDCWVPARTKSLKKNYLTTFQLFPVSFRTYRLQSWRERSLMKSPASMRELRSGMTGFALRRYKYLTRYKLVSNTLYSSNILPRTTSCPNPPCRAFDLCINAQVVNYPTNRLASLNKDLYLAAVKLSQFHPLNHCQNFQ